MLAVGPMLLLLILQWGLNSHKGQGQQVDGQLQMLRSTVWYCYGTVNFLQTNWNRNLNGKALESPKVKHWHNLESIPTHSTLITLKRKFLSWLATYMTTYTFVHLQYVSLFFYITFYCHMHISVNHRLRYQNAVCVLRNFTLTSTIIVMDRGIVNQYALIHTTLDK